MGVGSSAFGKRAVEMALGEKRPLTSATAPPARKGPLMPGSHRLWGKKRGMRASESITAIVLGVTFYIFCCISSSSAGWHKNEFLNMTGVIAKAMNISECWICYALPSHAEQHSLATVGLPLNEDEWAATQGRRISTGDQEPISAAALHRYWAPLCVKRASTEDNRTALGTYYRCVITLEEVNGSLTLTARRNQNITELLCPYYLYDGNGSDHTKYLHFNLTVFTWEGGALSSFGDFLPRRTNCTDFGDNTLWYRGSLSYADYINATMIRALIPSQRCKIINASGTNWRKSEGFDNGPWNMSCVLQENKASDKFLYASEQGIFFLCGKGTYKQLPPGWVGTCTLGYLIPRISVHKRISISEHHPQRIHRREVETDKMLTASWDDGAEYIPNTLIDEPFWYQRLARMFITGVGYVGLENTIKNMSRIIERSFNDTAIAINALQKEVAGLSGVVIQNRLVLDQMLATQGGVCLSLNQTCCVYTDRSGEIMTAMEDLKQNIDILHAVGIVHPATGQGMGWDPFSWLGNVFGGLGGIIVKWLLQILIIGLAIYVSIKILFCAIAKCCKKKSVISAMVLFTDEPSEEEDDYVDMSNNSTIQKEFLRLCKPMELI